MSDMISRNATPALIFGATGQVGAALAAQLGPRARALTRTEADFRDGGSLLKMLEAHCPSAVINAAAYTAVDNAEHDRELAWQVNATAPSVIARWCANRGVAFVHYSTDYGLSRIR